VVSFIEGEAAKLGFEIVPDGEVFARVLPQGWRDSVLGKYLGTLSPPPRPSASDISAARNDMIPRGAIMFRGADINQALPIYADLRNCTFIRSPVLSCAPLWLTTRNTLSKQEAIYALDVILAMNGIAMIKDGDKFVRVINIQEGLFRMQPHAPTPKPGENLIDPHDVPVLRLGPDFKRLLPASQTSSTSGPSKEQSPKANVDNLVAYYAKLTDCTAKSNEKLGAQPISFEAHTPLSKAELLYAIETALFLSGLEIVRVDDKTIRVERIADPRKPR
jgi:hypothetical protein